MMKSALNAKNKITVIGALAVPVALVLLIGDWKK